MGTTTGIKGLYLKRGYYYFQPSMPKGGGLRPKAMALDTQDLVTAIQTLEEKRADLEGWQAARRRTMDELLPRYFKDKAGDSPQARRQREMVLKSFSEVLGNPRVESVTPEMVEQWRDHVHLHGANPAGERQELARDGKRKRPKVVVQRSPATLKTYTIVAKAFFNWAVEHKMIPGSPMKRMKRQTQVSKTKRQEFLTEEQREAALAAESPPYLKLILHLGFFAGLRDGEMLAMTPAWLWISKDWSHGTITVQEQKIPYKNGTHGTWRPKVREMRQIPIHARLLEFLKNHGIESPWILRPDKKFWPDPSLNSKRFDAHRALNGLAKRAGLPKLNYHILRHSFATHLVMKGVSLADVAGLLGDTLKVTEENYAGYSPSKKNPLSVL